MGRLRWLILVCIAVTPLPGAASAGEGLAFAAERLAIDSFLGTVRLERGEGERLRVRLLGPPLEEGKITLRVERDTLTIRREGPLPDHGILDLSDLEKDYPTLEVTLPVSTPVDVHGLMGRFALSFALSAPLSLEGPSVSGEASGASSMALDLPGTAELDIGRVENSIAMTISGSARVSVAEAGDAALHTSGTSEIDMGKVAGRLEVDCSGSGEFRVTRHEGDAKIGISGSASVHVLAGKIQSLDINISGAGEVTVDAPVGDAKVAVSGAGSVFLASVAGRLERHGHGAVVVGK